MKFCSLLSLPRAIIHFDYQWKSHILLGVISYYYLYLFTEILSMSQPILRISSPTCLKIDRSMAYFAVFLHILTVEFSLRILVVSQEIICKIIMFIIIEERKQLKYELNFFQEKVTLLSQVHAQESVIEGLKSERKIWGEELAQQGTVHRINSPVTFTSSSDCYEQLKNTL